MGNTKLLHMLQLHIYRYITGLNACETGFRIVSGVDATQRHKRLVVCAPNTKGTNSIISLFRMFQVQATSGKARVASFLGKITIFSYCICDRRFSRPTSSLTKNR